MSSTTHAHRIRSSADRVLGGGLAALLALACTSTSKEPRQSGSLEELLQMATAGDAQPVRAQRDDVSVGSLNGGGAPFEPPDEIAEVEQALAEAYAESARLDEATEPAQEPSPRKKNPYLAFGGRIIVHDDGRITKPYPLPPGKGRRMLDLMKLVGSEGLLPIIEVDADHPGPPDANVIRAVLLPNWDAELYQNIRSFPPTDKEVPMADWLVFTAGFDLMEEVDYFIDLFGAGVRQFEIEAKIVEISETDTFDWGVPEAIAEFPSNAFVDTLSLAFPNAAGSEDAILSLGAVQDGTTYTAILEAIQKWDNVSIIAQPKIAVREGGRAVILNIEELPFLNVKSISGDSVLNSTLDYKEVGVQLYIIPRVVGTNTLALNIDFEASQPVGTQTTVSGIDDVDAPTIARRSVNTIVYLKEGQALILGGLTVERTEERERKIPLLGDIPLLGYLFKSRFTATTRSNVLFFIRPRLLQGTDLNRDF
jgi:type II secretory pathway component GspD/PulD (secretin)